MSPTPSNRPGHEGDHQDSRNIRDTPGGGPTVLRMMLGAQLRELRERAGYTREAAGGHIRGSHAKISRLELGRVGFKERDVVDLLTLYGITDVAEREPLVALARRANEPGWWHQWSDLLPHWFETYMGLEQAAVQIRTYEPQFVPGLLQTAGMSRAIAQLGHTTISATELTRRVDLRMRRRRILDSDEPPTLWAVLDEAALRRAPGGRAVMREQIEHLVEQAGHPNIVVQLVPFEIGGHAGAGGPFSILRFARESEVPDIVYLEQLTSALYLDKRTDVDDYLATMELLCVQALSPKDTLVSLEKMLVELGGGA